jgi:hypothetical protein
MCHCKTCADRLHVIYSLVSCLFRFPVFILVHSVHFSAFWMHYPYCTTPSVRTRNCRLLRHFRDVTLTPARITDITLSRKTLAPAAISCRGFGTRFRRRRSKRSNIFGPYIPYGLFQTKGEMCAKYGSDWFRNVNLYRYKLTNKQIFSFVYKIGWYNNK